MSRWWRMLGLGLAGVGAARAATDVAVSFDGRVRYERYEHLLWGQGPQDGNGYWLERGLLAADWRATPDVAVLAQLQSSRLQGRDGGPRATDEDRLDVHQLVVKWKPTSELSVRVGRQELAFGSSRLISVRESPNVRLAFDGVRGGWRRGERAIDVLAVRPAKTLTGTFDDSTDQGQSLAGVYATRPIGGGSQVDLYYLRQERERARFAAGTAREERHSLGTRVFGGAKGWDWNFEAVGQAGRFGDGRISAWTVATDTGYTWSGVRGSPRFGLKADVASGDRRPGADRLGTFNALYPRGAYFGEGSLIGPANLRDVHPSVTWRPWRALTLGVEAGWFWRDQAADGLYGSAVTLLRAAGQGAGRLVGAQRLVSLDWKVDARWTVSLWASRFDPGAYLRATGAAERMDYLSFTTRVRL